MDEILEFCSKIFDTSPQPFGVAHVLLDSEGRPEDFTYAYLNPSMAAMTNQQVEELKDVAVYKHWPDSDPTWVEYFYKSAYEGTAEEFEAVSIILEQFLDIYCNFYLLI